MQKPTKKEGCGKRSRCDDDEWRRLRRRRAEAQREGEAEAPGNATTNQMRGARQEAEV
jgi:hypothetical protein